MFKIVHCADIHAGRPAPSALDQDRASTRRREIETGLQRVADLCRREKADLLLVSGDMFEHLYARPSWAKEAATLFREMPGTRVFISPGNHDPVVRGSLYRSVEWPGNVTIFDTPEIRAVSVGDPGVTVYGFGWTSFIERREALKGFAADRRDGFSVLVIHGDVVRAPAAQAALFGEVAETASQYLPVSPEDLEKCGVDYVALGHIHAPGQFKAGRSTVVYPGCPEPLDFGDRGARGAYLVTVSDRRVDAQFVPLNVRQMRSTEVDISSLETPEQVRNAVLSSGDASARKQDLWTITLTGAVDPDLGLDVSVLERELSQEFFFLRVAPGYRPAYDLEALADARNLSLEARFVRELKAAVRDARARGDARAEAISERALYYGLDALRQGKILLRKGASD